MAQVEGILSLLPGGKKLVALEVSSPTLVEGAVTVTLESVNKIDYVIGSIRDPDNADAKWISMSYAVGEAANAIDVTFQVGSTTEWAAAETTDVADKIVSFLVIGA